MKSILKQLKDNDATLEVGRNATEEELRRLKVLRNACCKGIDKLRKRMSINERKMFNHIMVLGTKAQFCREAIQASTIK
jgi:peptidoglycan hydrolase CwlO-like protein